MGILFAMTLQAGVVIYKCVVYRAENFKG